MAPRKPGPLYPSQKNIKIMSFLVNTPSMPGTSFLPTFVWSKKPDDMIPNAFKACFEVLFKQHDDCKADFKSMIGEKERTFASTHSPLNVVTCLSINKKYHKMTIDDFVDSSRPVIQWTSLFMTM